MFLDTDIFNETEEFVNETFDIIEPLRMTEGQVRVFNIEEHSKFVILEDELDAVAESLDNKNIYEAFTRIAEAHGIDSEHLYVLTEESDILAKKKEILEKLKKSRSSKERKKLLTKLKSLNKIKFVNQKK